MSFDFLFSNIEYRSYQLVRLVSTAVHTLFDVQEFVSFKIIYIVHLKKYIIYTRITSQKIHKNRVIYQNKGVFMVENLVL